MKNITNLAFTLLIVFQFTSCNSDKKEELKTTKLEKDSTAAFVLNDANNSVEWTAYKTTEKVPVKGKFTKVDVTSGGEGKTAGGQ